MKLVTIKHPIIVSNHTFRDIQSTLKASLSLVNKTYSTLLTIGDVTRALLSLQTLLILNIFIMPPQNFSNLLRMFNRTNKAI